MYITVFFAEIYTNHIINVINCDCRWGTRVFN